LSFFLESGGCIEKRIFRRLYEPISLDTHLFVCQVKVELLSEHSVAVSALGAPASVEAGHRERRTLILTAAVPSVSADAPPCSAISHCSRANIETKAHFLDTTIIGR
jgi:hypothetical protein